MANRTHARCASIWRPLYWRVLPVMLFDVWCGAVCGVILYLYYVGHIAAGGSGRQQAVRAGGAQANPPQKPYGLFVSTAVPRTCARYGGCSEGATPPTPRIRDEDYDILVVEIAHTRTASLLLPMHFVVWCIAKDAVHTWDNYWEVFSSTSWTLFPN